MKREKIMAESNAKFPDGAVLVIGASGGIGSKVAMTLSADGCDLALCYNRKRTAVDAVAKDVEQVGRRASLHHIDVTSPESINAGIDTAIEVHGRIHTLVWAAGPIASQVHLGETSLGQWRNAFEIEVHGLFATVQALLPHMRKKGGGSIVHLGSAGHLRWPDKDGLSVAPKAANESFLRGIAREEGRHNIRANSVLVGVIDAGMFHTLSGQGAFPQSWIDETQKMLAIKRWGEAEEIGYAVSFLASNRAAYITGQQINVSGGYGL